MNITKIKLYGRSTFNFPLVGATPSDLYILKGVDGLGPPGVDVFISRTTAPVGVYQGRRPQPRQVVLSIGLNPNYTAGQTPSDMRTAFYASLLSYAPIGVALFEDPTEITPRAVTYGYISKLETAIFSKEPGLQITIDCLDSYLRAPNPTVLTPGSGLTNNQSAAINYIGDAPAGLKARIQVKASSSSFSLTNVSTGSSDYTSQTMYVNEAVQVDDIIDINTNFGNRSLTKTRGSTTTNIVGKMETGSGYNKWAELIAGSNSFTFGAYYGAALSHNWVSLEYTPQYWGI